MASIFCRYLDGTTKICNNTEGFSDIKVNGTSIGLTTTYNVSSSDEVEFILSGTEIMQEAFFYCTGLTSLVIPDSVTTIEQYAFYRCIGLTSITLGSGVTTIGNNAFERCTGLTSLDIPDSVTTIRNNAFSYCTGLTSLDIPDSVTTIGPYAFSYCTGLTSLDIPDSVTTIGSGAFSNCESLREITLPNTLETIEGSLFLGCYNLESLVIPDSVTSIKGNVFDSVSNLKTLTIGSGLKIFDTTISSPLETIICRGEVAPVFKPHYFQTGKNGTFYYPSGSDYTNWLILLKGVMGYNVVALNPDGTPDNTVIQPEYAAQSSIYCKYNKTGSVKICNDLTSIIDIKINGVSINLVDTYNLNADDEVEFVIDGITVPEECFKNCENIKSVVLGDTIKIIGDSSFLDDVSLDYIEIPNGVAFIGQFAFGGCTSLTNIYIPDSVNVIEVQAFDRCTNLQTIDGGRGIAYIDMFGFDGCSSLQTIVLYDKLLKLGTYAFRNCTSLTNIVLPESLCYIEDGCFDGCSSLNEIKISAKKAPEIASYTFYGVKRQGTLYYPNGSDYSTWLSTDKYYLGYYEWNDTQMEPDTPVDPDDPDNPVDPDNPDNPVDPEETTFELEYISLSNVPSSGYRRTLGVYKQGITSVVVASPEWVEVSEIEKGYNIVISSNDVAESRDGVITFTAYGKDETITRELAINQKGEDLYLNISPTEILSPAIGLTTEINVETNATKLDINNPIWINVSKKDNTTYEVVISMEDKGDERSGEITFIASAEGQSSITKKVTIYQEAYERGYIILSDNEFLLNDESDTREMEVTYVNIASIIPPVIPDGYEIVGEEKVEPSEGVVQVNYTIQKTSANVGVFTTDFKGVDGNGNTVTSEPLTVDGWSSAKKGAEIDGFRFKGVTEDNDFHHMLGMEDTFIFQYVSEARYIEFNINGYTKPFEVSCTVNDPNGVLTFTDGVIDYDDGQDYAVYQLLFNSTGNSTNAPLEGTIDIHYTDEKTNITKTIPFYIRYANQGFIDPFSNNYEFDKDGVKIGLYDNIGVGYFNIQTINTPTCSPWISLSAPYDESTYYETGKSYRYDITVEPNDGAERTGVITFSGLGVDGKTWAAEVSLFQEGNDTVQIIDEGFIELQSLSVVLPAEGGTDTFQVKYYDAYSIEMPELVGNWATIKELSRTSENGVAWNGEECVVTTITYQVEVGPTTTGREMKVICRSKINYYDGSYISMEKDKFRIQQLAPGSVEWQGTVYPFKNQETYDTYGSGDSIRVGYSDVVVLDPIVSADWVTIKTITDKTSSSKEYDSIKEYTLELDINKSEVSRTATITFRGENEDGTKTQSIVTITQKGMEPKDDAGNYNNYRGYFTDLEGKLYSVSIITNPHSTAFGEIILAGDSPVVVSYSDSERLYTPIRTSTCTIRVVSERYLMDIYTGKAQGTQVILKDEDTGEVKWCGFLQPNLYNQGFSEPIETIELEASDCLSTLQYLNYEDYYVNGRMTITFSYIIESILDRSKLINTYYLTQRLYSDAFQSKYLRFNNLYIAEQNFYSEEDEPWKLKEVLEEICKYMGLVCFQWGDAVYFLDYDMYNSNKQMVGFKYTKQERWNDQELVVIASTANKVVEESYRDTGADISLDDVFNKVTVNCSYYDVEDLIPDLFEDDLLTNRFGDGSMFSISRYTGRGNSTLSTKTYYKVYDHKNINSLYYLPLNRPGTGGYETKAVPTDTEFEDRFFFRKYVGGNIIDMIHLNYDEANGKPGASKDWDRYLLISQLNRPWCGAEGTFHWENYNFPIMEFKDLPVIFLDNTGDENVERTTLTRSGIGTSSSRPNNRQAKPVPAPNYLVIEASAIFCAELKKEYYEGITEGLSKKTGKDYYNYVDGYTFDHIRNTPALCFYLEIPQAGWWDGSKWVDYETYFEVPLEYFGENAEDKKYYEHLWGISKNVENTIATNLFLGTTGYKIPLPKEMTTTQQMYFAIAMPKRFAHLSDSDGGDYTGDAGNAYCFIKDFSMKIVNRNSSLYEEEDVIYENVIDMDNVIEGDEIELKITSDRYQGYSYSNVSTFKADGTPTTDIMFYNKDYELVKPEEAIIERYVNQYSTPSIKTNLTLDMSFVPYQLITDTYWNKNFVIIGQEIDYQMARQQITLLEKK